MTVIGDLASFAARADASTQPQAERDRLRLHIADTVVAALAGARVAEGKALQNLGGGSGLAERTGRRAAAARLTEIDDIHLPSCTTPSAGIVPVALELAAALQNFDANEIASAIWAGTAVMTRIGMAVDGPQILYRGVWPSYLAAPIATAATAARIFGLDEAKTAHALSLAFMLSAGGVGRIHGAPSGRWFLYANAVTAGVAAAQAARAGYRGDPDLLEKNWLADTHGIALDRERLYATPMTGSVYGALSMKPFCSAKQGIAAIEAFRSILDAGVRPQTIAKVRVRVPPAYAGMIGMRAALAERQSTMVSVAHQIALAAFAPELLYDVDRSAAVTQPAVADFSRKVEVISDTALRDLYPRHWPAEVEVEAAGTMFRRRIVEAFGDPERPLGHSDIAHKAHRVLDALVGSARVDEWLAMCDGAITRGAACRSLITAFAGE